MPKVTSIGLLATVTIAASLAALVASASGKDKRTLTVVSSVDLSRYAGLWYEFARLPNRFEDGGGKNCSFVTAEYALREDGRISVTNRCRKQNGKTDVAKGVARVRDKQTNSRLEVNFAPSFLGFLPFVWGEYNIIALAPDYSHALVGSSDRKYLWVLSRTPALDEATYKSLLEKAASEGFDVSKMQKTKQTE